MISRGFSRSEIKFIAAVIRSWPGGWTMDLVGDVLNPAIVLIAEAGDRYAPALHLGFDGEDIVVEAVMWDTPTKIGTFSDLDEALAQLSQSINGGNSRITPHSLH